MSNQASYVHSAPERAKMHLGVDAATGLAHTAIGTAANVSDVSMAGQLHRDDDRVVFADAGYTGAGNRPENEGKSIDWQVARKRGTVKRLAEGEVKTLTQSAERLKASIRAKVEHPFHIVKNLFGHKKTRYRGIAKNQHQWQVLFALANVYMTKKAIVAGSTA